MEYQVKTISQLCTKITDGSHFSPENDINSNIPMYSVKDMDYNGFFGNGYKTIGEDVFEKMKRNDCVPHKNDVLIAKDGSYLKYVFKAKETYNAAILSSIAILRPNTSIVDPDYFVYLLRTNSVKNAMANYVSGSALPRIILSDFKKMKIRIVQDINTQKRIADVLIRYDQLIEINKTRIKLLEKAAKDIYKEWFVRLRFPGYETAEFYNGKPRNWSIIKLSDIIEIRYGKDHKAILDGSIPIYGSGGTMRYGDKELYCGESVLIPRKGSLNNIMWVNGSFWTVDTMFYSVMKKENIAKYLYMTLSKYDMESLNSGASIPSMTTEILSHLKIVVPDEQTLLHFEKIIQPIYKERSMILEINNNLIMQRDTLLPRLMSGKIVW